MEKIRVLLADDNQAVRGELPSLLEADDDVMVVATAANGWEAISRTSETNPDVIVMDVKMPLLDGISATRMIKKSRPGVKIIVLSIYDNAKFIHESIAAGADAYLVKNADTDDLVNLVRRMYTKSQEDVFAKGNIKGKS